MCDIEKVFSELNGTLNEFYIFILNSVRFILKLNLLSNMNAYE